MSGTEHVDCLVCTASPMLQSKRYAGLLVCDSCGFITADMHITEEEAEKLYGKDYFHGQEYSDYTRDKTIIQKNFSHRLKTLGRFIKDSHSNLLEIGCAYGFFLDLSKDLFKSVKGIDISADAVEYAVNVLKVNATAGDFTETEATAYDICCMWDTIEHLREPDRFIEKISAEISTGGLLAITTSDIGSFNARIRGKKWRQIHPPTHLHYFSVKTLKRLLDRCGFDTIHISHPANIINVETALYTILCLKRGKTELYERLTKIIRKIKIIPMNVPVNFFDTMYIIARKN